MPCVALPAAPVPSLPGGITLAAPLPTFSGSLEVCCKVVNFPTVTPPVQLPAGTVNLFGPLNVILDQVRVYLRARPVSCPKE